MGTQVISFNCVLKNKAGKLISTTYSREVLTSSAEQNVVLAGLSKNLQNLSKGEKRTVVLRAEEAYGLYIPQKVILFPRSRLPKRTQVGEVVSIVGKSGQVQTYKVLEFHHDMVSLDGNHPLAGQDLIFEIETLDVREATPEEISESLNPFSNQVLH